METTYTLSIMPLFQPAKSKIADLKHKAQVRQENIKNLFYRTIHSMDTVQKTYDYCYDRLSTYSMCKHDFYVLHNRAYLLTLKLLSK